MLWLPRSRGWLNKALIMRPYELIPNRIRWELWRQGAMPPGAYKTRWRDVLRWLIHIPIGVVIIGLIMLVPQDLGGPWPGIIIGLTFFVYEILEDIRVRDWSFIDVFGSLIGMVGAAIVIMQIYERWPWSYGSP